MKKIFLMRHSIPEKGDMPNERIPLSEKGKSTCCIKTKHFFKGRQMFFFPHRRAIETAECIADHPVIVEELHERTIGDAREDFWLKQYEDYDFRNPGGESLNQVKVRMKNSDRFYRRTDGRRRNSTRGFSCDGDLRIFAFLL